MKGVLITGATGNVGSRLVQEYLTTTDCRLFLLVRAESDRHAEERIERILQFWGTSANEYPGRITVLPGDIAEQGLGLSSERVQTLRGQIQRVVHIASSLRLDMPIEKARQQILHATENVFEFARQLDSLEMFGYSSTMEVMGRYRGEIAEEFLTNYNVPFLNNYEVAKFETEEYLRGMLARGYPITLFRISMVVGETTTGRVLRFQSFYLLTEKLILDADFPVLPKDPPIDAIPVDFLARCIIKIMDNPDSQGTVYHLSQGRGDAISFDEYFELVKPMAEARLGHRVRKPLTVWSGFHRGLFRLLTAVTFGKLRRFFRVQLIFLSFFGLPGVFDNKRTKVAMRKLGLEWPAFRDYAPILLDYYFAHRKDNRLPF